MSSSMAHLGSAVGSFSDMVKYYTKGHCTWAFIVEAASHEKANNYLGRNEFDRRIRLEIHEHCSVSSVQVLKMSEPFLSFLCNGCPKHSDFSLT